LHAKFPTLEVIFMSGYTRKTMPGGALPDRYAFLEKPFSETALVETIEGLLESS
jgi:FixJ family two-component response regulator